MASPAAREPGPLVTLVLSRTVEKVDSDFRHYLGDLGYSTSAAKKHGYLLVQLARWFDDEGVAIYELTTPRRRGSSEVGAPARRTCERAFAR